ncbi:MAG: outer membrane beta-barrel protein [Nitrospirae bacterium]|nr:outer membrane beta-barrel protein [Nitrospirota bacterium]
MQPRIFHLFVGILIGMAMTTPAMAAEFEITPFAGYTAGGEFTNASTGNTLSFDETSSYGIMLDFRQAGDADAWIEVYLSRQQTKLKADQGLFTGNPLLDVNVEYYHIGGTYGQATGKIRPFVVGTFGATHMVPKQEGLDSETKFSLSLGGGVKMYLTEHVGIRLDARWFGTLFNGSGGVFCSNGACLVTVQGDVLSQFTANAGIILAF